MHAACIRFSKKVTGGQHTPQCRPGGALGLAQRGIDGCQQLECGAVCAIGEALGPFMLGQRLHTAAGGQGGLGVEQGM